MQPEMEIKQEPKPELDQGICRTCIHAGDCKLRSDPSKPIYECEEFSAGPTPETPGRLRLVSSPANQSQNETEGLKGLCINCEHRATCTLPRPESGVWHCEEYE